MEKKEIKKELFEKYNWDLFFTEATKENVWKWVEEKLDKAREEGKIEGRLEALPITIEEVKNAKIKLLKRIISKYQKMGSSAGDYAMVYVESELDKLNK